MPVIDKTQPKPRRKAPIGPENPPAPYQIHRPNVAAIDAQPRAGDPRPPPPLPLPKRKIPTR